MVESASESSYFASVVRVIDQYSVVINKGSDDGVSKGDQFLVYFIETDELLDPETGESLGKLEVVRGTGSAVHVQEKMTTVKSNRTVSRGRVVRKTLPRANPLFGNHLLGNLGGSETIEEPAREALPFDGVRVNDKVKPI